MKKINLSVTGCMGRMGQQIIKSSNKKKEFRLVSLTENKVINKKISGIKLSLIPEIFLLITLFSVRETNLNSFFLLEDFIICWPILPMQPVIDKLIFFIRLLCK